MKNPGYVLAVLFISTLLNAAYFLPIVHAAFFRKAEAGDEHHSHGEAPWPMVLALVTTATMTVALFFYSTPLVQMAGRLVAVN